MPNIKSAKKRMELSRSSRTKNRAERSRIRSAIKQVRQAATADEAQPHLVRAQALLDRAATRRLFHPNQVARVKGKLQQHVNTLSA
jgi:small subunit ribosomal protein S20